MLPGASAKWTRSRSASSTRTWPAWGGKPRQRAKGQAALAACVSCLEETRVRAARLEQETETLRRQHAEAQQRAAGLAQALEAARGHYHELTASRSALEEQRRKAQDEHAHVA